MSPNEEIAQRLRHFGDHIEDWRKTAAQFRLRVARSAEQPASEAELVDLEQTAGAIYADITAFKATIDEVAARSPAAAAELAPVSDAIHLVLLEITELGIRLYSEHSGLPHAAGPHGQSEAAKQEELATAGASNPELPYDVERAGAAAAAGQLRPAGQ